MFKKFSILALLLSILPAFVQAQADTNPYKGYQVSALQRGHFILKPIRL